MSHPPITFLADINHRVRTFGNALWKLKAMGKRHTDCTRVDCQRLKRNFSYWIWRYNGTTLEEFRERANAIVRHHFNDHSHCDASWCPHTKKTKEESALTGKYRDYETHKKLWEQLCEILDRFLTPLNLKDIFHKYHSQKTRPSTEQ